MKKRVVLIAVIYIITLAVMAIACSHGEPEVAEVIIIPEPTPTPTPVPTPEPESEIDLTGLAVNPMTGLFVDEETAVRRPVAVVVNNLRRALPQSGISQADIVYEVLAEGDVTRLVALFRDFDSEKIGPVRSARDYFLIFAADHDAIFIHHGASPQGYNIIRNHGVNNLDGMREATTFWRDQERLRQGAFMLEHSSYTDAERIFESIERRGFRADVAEGAASVFAFFNPFEDDLFIPTGASAVMITVPYSRNYTRRFEFDAERGVYAVFQGDAPHIDEETGEQLTVTNVLVQTAVSRVIDNEGRRDVTLIGSGTGILFTGGGEVPVRWEKPNFHTPTRWTLENGAPMTMNPGQTWVNVFGGEVIVLAEFELEFDEDEPFA